MRFSSALLLLFISGIATANDGLAVVLSRGSVLAPGVLAAMQNEVESLFSPTGVSISWRSEQDTDMYRRIAVIRITGPCTAEPPALAVFRRASEIEALGETEIVNGKVIPFGDVKCDAVRRVIARELRTTPSWDRDEMLGRALGRVLAHELYHILLQSTLHGRTGISRPAQTSADLIGPGNSFSAADHRKVYESSTQVAR
jgi:hypothetical protein